MIGQHFDNPPRREGVLDGVGATLVNIGQAHRLIGPFTLQPVEQPLGQPQVFTDESSREEAKGFAGVVFRQLDASGHVLAVYLRGAQIAHQRQHASKPRCVFGQLVCQTSNRFKRTTGRYAALDMVSIGDPCVARLMREPAEEFSDVRIGGGLKLALLVSAVGTVYLGVFPARVLDWTMIASALK